MIAHMANRRLSRSIVLQTLFEWDASDYTLDMTALEERLQTNKQEFGATQADDPFMRDLLKTIMAKRQELDDIVGKAAPEWPIDKIARIDRNILRIGLAELLFADRAQVPAKVAINEAIELAKTFGSESSGKFINGVLGAVYVELGEPGKDDAPKRKEKIPREKMKLELLAGAVVYAEHEGEVYLAFVHDIFGHWTISKGKLEGDDSDLRQAAVREIKEEMGLDITIEAELGVNEYIANDPDAPGGKKRKQVNYFLGKSNFDELTLGPSGGLDDAQWFPLSQVGNLNFYDDTLKIIIPALNLLAQKKVEK